MKLKTGDKAPGFSVVDCDGRPVVLEDLTRQGSVALVFLRYMGCPICQLGLGELKKNYGRFSEKNCSIVVFVQSPQATLENNGCAGAFLFHVVGDPDGHLYEMYGVGTSGIGGLIAPATVFRGAEATFKGHRQGKMEGNIWQLPGDFIVDRSGRLTLARIGRNFGDSLGVEGLLGGLN